MLAVRWANWAVRGLILVSVGSAAGASAEEPESQPASRPARESRRGEQQKGEDERPGVPRELREGKYSGVAPWAQASADAKPSARPARKWPRPTVTWVGFESVDGAARIFLQLSAAGTFEQRVAGDELLVRLPGFSLDPANNARPLDTRFFTTDVTFVEARRVRARTGRGGRRGVELHVRFKQPGDAREAVGRLERASDGYHYLVLDLGPPAPAAAGN